MNGGFSLRSVVRLHSGSDTAPTEEKHMPRNVALSLLAASLALIFSGPGRAGPREEQLDKYAAAARAASPAFAGGKPDTPACTSCHGNDTRGAGRNPGGKSIEAMALSASPSRYTDPAKVEKWFKRNCNEVLGRECTPLEKGDWMIFMIGQ